MGLRDAPRTDGQMKLAYQGGFCLYGEQIRRSAAFVNHPLGIIRCRDDGRMAAESALPALVISGTDSMVQPPGEPAILDAATPGPSAGTKGQTAGAFAQ